MHVRWLMCHSTRFFNVRAILIFFNSVLIDCRFSFRPRGATSFFLFFVCFAAALPLFLLPPCPTVTIPSRRRAPSPPSSPRDSPADRSSRVDTSTRRPTRSPSTAAEARQRAATTVRSDERTASALALTRQRAVEKRPMEWRCDAMRCDRHATSESLGLRQTSARRSVAARSVAAASRLTGAPHLISFERTQSRRAAECVGTARGAADQRTVMRCAVQSLQTRRPTDRPPSDLIAL